MHSVNYSMERRTGGYIVRSDVHLDWTVPDKEVFRFWIDEIREVGDHRMGRRLYETMRYWETTASQEQVLDEAESRDDGRSCPRPGSRMAHVRPVVGPPNATTTS